MLEDVLELRTTMRDIEGIRRVKSGGLFVSRLVEGIDWVTMDLELFPRIVGIVSPSIDVWKRLKGIYFECTSSGIWMFNEK